ncbi:UDP-N-acetylglucosamine 2-epimerase (non-hydrolyzing) [Verrucomicrobia bacterium]|nr:UDP-N-acetylglucosamine 2-epimerase (non-hydrolyzing) [Verrucomicrobiota bacterium]
MQIHVKNDISKTLLIVLKKIISILGARPQFIKAAVVSSELLKINNINEIIIHTGQHYDTQMSEIFFQQLNIPAPKYNLGIISKYHGDMTGRQIIEIEKVLKQEVPELVIVYGDTNSTLAGCIAASKLNIPIAHIEAGLRSFNKKMPEEINRIIADHISSYLFVPTEGASKNLLKEGLPKKSIYNVGDVMYDASLRFRKMASPPAKLTVSKILLKEFILATIHRAENTNDLYRLKNILNGMGDSENQIILPLHPRTEKIIKNNNLSIPDNIICIPPVSYFEMLWLQDNCKLICTDSGGLQKEAYFFKKSCIVTRDETEWQELVDCGWNHLVGANKKLIAECIKQNHTNEIHPQFYGNGHSALDIASKLSTLI